LKDEGSNESKKLAPVPRNENSGPLGFKLLPEVGVPVPKTKKKGREVASRYKKAAKDRATPTPTKAKATPSKAKAAPAYKTSASGNDTHLEESCVSVNQSQLFSTATASTPNQSKSQPAIAASKTQKKPPLKVPALPTGADKASNKLKKAAPKTASVKTKPMRALDTTKSQATGDSSDRLPEHKILYNEYLQWTYLCRMTEVKMRREAPQLQLQTRQLAAMLEKARRDTQEAERKLQAVTLYGELWQLDRDVTELLATLQESSEPMREDLARLTESLDATRNKLKFKSLKEPTDAAGFKKALLAAAQQCRERVGALAAAASSDSSLLQHTAEAVTSLQGSLADGMRDLRRSMDLVQELSSLSLQEASLVTVVAAPEAD